MIWAMSVASVCSSRMMRTSLTASAVDDNVDLPNQVGNLGHVAGAAWTIREVVRASAVTRTAGLKPPRVGKRVLDRRLCRRAREAYLRWKTWNWVPGTAGWSSRAISSITVFTFSGRPTIRIVLGIARGVMLTAPCRAMIDFVVQGLDHGAMDWQSMCFIGKGSIAGCVSG